MASSLIRFHRTIRALSGLHRLFPVTSASPSPAPIHGAVLSKPPFSQPPSLIVQSRLFRSSSISLLSARSSLTNELDEIGPDSILFEGCDYNHWLIVMNFPKDECNLKDPDPEEMIWTYEQTCAKGLNISVEEAKKKIYACSTTTYTGFQVVMTEEESKKFEDLPGVIFVLPDSYIDPINKEYGGDKYINGTIIPRPPPVQYGRYQGRRERNRNPGQYNPGSMQGDGRNYRASQNYPPQQNYSQASQNYAQAPQNYPPQQNHPQNYPQNYGQAPQNYPPQQNHGQAPQSYPPQQNHGQGQAPQNYPPQQNYGQAPQSYPPQQNHGQAPQNYPYPPQQGYGQASQNYPQQQTYGSASQQGSGPASPQYAPQQSFGSPGQGGRRDSVPEPRGTEWGYTFKPSSTYAKDGIPSYIEDFKPSYMQEFEQAAKGDYFARQTGKAGSAQNESSSSSEDDRSGEQSTEGEQSDAQGEGRN